MRINGETLQLHAGIGSIMYGAVYKKRYFLLQATRESVSGTTSHVCCV